MFIIESIELCFSLPRPSSLFALLVVFEMAARIDNEKFFSSFIRKGETAWNSFLDKISDPDIVDRISQPPLGYEIVVGDKGRAGVPVELEQRLANASFDGESWRSFSISPSVQGSEKGIYYWEIDPRGAILILYTNKEKDDNPNTLRMEYQEILWRNWMSVPRENDESLGALRYIWRCFISNPATERMISIINEHMRSQNELIIFRPGNPEFFALLASPNGKFLTKFLIDHCEDLGRKTVEAVHLYRPNFGDASYLCWVLANFEMPSAPSTPGSKHKKSAAKLRRENARKSSGGGGSGEISLGSPKKSRPT